MEMKKDRMLDIRYAVMQALFWMTYCTMIGYASVYLLAQGFNNAMIGIILSVSSIIAVVLQPVLASYIDKSKKLSLSTLVSISLIGVAILSTLLYMFASIDVVLLLCIIIIFTGMVALQPFINSLSFAFEKRGYSINFGLARGIGSVAYATTSLLLGNIFEVYDASMIPLLYVGMTIILWISVITFKPSNKGVTIVDEKQEDETKQLSLLQFVKKYHTFMFLLIGVVCIFFDHTIINNFFIQIVQNVGGTSGDMGKAIFLAAMLELPVMAFFSVLCKKFECSRLLILSGIFFSIKHILTLLAPSMSVIYIAQVLQMGAYALFIPASVYYVGKLVDRSDLTKGQALVTGAMTLSSVFASFLGGILLDIVGATELLLIGAIVSVIGSIILVFTVEKIKE